MFSRKRWRYFDKTKFEFDRINLDKLNVKQFDGDTKEWAGMKCNQITENILFQ